MHDRLNFLFQEATAVEQSCILSSSMLAYVVDPASSLLEALIFLRMTTHVNKQQARYEAIIVHKKYPLDGWRAPTDGVWCIANNL